MRYFFEVSYRGTNYHGWQLQKNARGVQQVINQALSKIVREDVTTFGSGRTDKGVHAEQQFFHVDIDRTLPTDDLLYKLNVLLPPDISIRGIFPVSDQSHARFDAIERHYEYRIIRVKYPFGPDLFYTFWTPLDLNKMNRASELLLGEKNFRAFSRVKTDVGHFICHVHQAVWKPQGDGLTFSISANRFLRGMVRAMVGTLLDVGQDRLSVNKFRQIIDGQDRTQAGSSAPAHGLYLCRVVYPKGILGN